MLGAGFGLCVFQGLMYLIHFVLQSKRHFIARQRSMARLELAPVYDFFGLPIYESPMTSKPNNETKTTISITFCHKVGLQCYAQWLRSFGTVRGSDPFPGEHSGRRRRLVGPYRESRMVCNTINLPKTGVRKPETR